MPSSKTKNFLAEDTRGLTSAHRGSRNETTRLEHLADAWALLSRMSLRARLLERQPELAGERTPTCTGATEPRCSFCDLRTQAAARRGALQP